MASSRSRSTPAKSTPKVWYPADTTFVYPAAKGETDNNNYYCIVNKEFSSLDKDTFEYRVLMKSPSDAPGALLLPSRCLAMSYAVSHCLHCAPRPV